MRGEWRIGADDGKRARAGSGHGARIRPGAKCEIGPDDEHSVRIEVGSYWLVSPVEAVGTLHRWTAVGRFDNGAFSTKAGIGGPDEVEYESRGAEIGDEEGFVVIEGGEHGLESTAMNQRLSSIQRRRVTRSRL